MAARKRPLVRSNYRSWLGSRARLDNRTRNHREDKRLKELEQYFKALGDSNRLRIINLLLHGELCVCDIQYVL